MFFQCCALRKIEWSPVLWTSEIQGASIWFVWKDEDFLVAQEQTLGARGHQALLKHSPDCLVYLYCGCQFFLIVTNPCIFVDTYQKVKLSKINYYFIVPSSYPTSFFCPNTYPQGLLFLFSPIFSDKIKDGSHFTTNITKTFSFTQIMCLHYSL